MQEDRLYYYNLVRPIAPLAFLPALSASTPPTLRRPRRGKAASVADAAAEEEEEDRAPLPRRLLSRAQEGTKD